MFYQPSLGSFATPTLRFPGQQSVWLQILEGELPFAKDNHVVGQLRLDGLQPAAGMGNRSLVEVAFDLDVSRLMWQSRDARGAKEAGLCLDVFVGMSCLSNV